MKSKKLRHGDVGAAVAFLAIVMAGCNSSSGASLSGSCSINTDCNSPLICAFGKCHNECNASRDCATGERCVSDGKDGVCELSSETTCVSSSCPMALVCGSDKQCRTPCIAESQCFSGQTCEGVSSTSAGACFDQTELGDGSVVATGDGSAIATDGGSQDGTLSGSDGSSGGAGDGSGGGPGDGGSDGTTSGNPCPIAQTQFGNIAQGDSNPNFTSGVGVRTAQQLLVFSGYSGPPLAGADAGDGGTVNMVFVQAFDLTGQKLGTAAPLFTAASGAEFTVDDVQVAPSGQIILLYSTGAGAGQNKSALYASFLSPAAEAGAGLQVGQAVQVESSTILYASDPYLSHPHAIWSVASQAFVVSYEYGPVSINGQPLLKVRKFLADGRGAGGDTNAVPTPTIFWGYDQGSTGNAGPLFAVAYGQGGPYYPGLTVLDDQGNQVGGFVTLSNVSLSTNWDFVTIGGTASGFATFFNQGGSVYEVFAPTAGDAGVPSLNGDAGDGGDAGTFTGFSFLSTAVTGRAISDDTGGAGGVGLVLLEQNAATFLYVKADGVSHTAPGSVLAHTFGTGDQVAITNFSGSFGISLYSAKDQSTQMAASGCTP